MNDVKNDEMPELIDPKETQTFHPPMDFTIKRKSSIKPALYFLLPCFLITFVMIFLSVTGSMEIPNYIYVAFIALMALNYYIINLIRKTPYSISIFSFQNLILIGYEQVKKNIKINQNRSEIKKKSVNQKICLISSSSNPKKKYKIQ